MDTEMMIRELKRVEEKHKHDKVFTGQLDVAKMAYDTRKRLEELKPYEDTGLTPEQIMELKEAVQKLENIFGDEITVNQVIDFFVDFYIAQGDPGRVEKAELLTNEEAAKWQELKERDTAKEILHIHQEFSEHQWRRTEKGKIDEFAMCFDYHNGPACERCGYSFCEHCEPNGWDEEPCVIDEYRCPNCNQEIGRSDKCCKYCGQMLNGRTKDVEDIHNI